jgi:serine/threonine protein kinase
MAGNTEIWGADQYSISLKIDNGGAVESLELSAVRALAQSDLEFINNRLALLSQIQSDGSFPVGQLVSGGAKAIIQSAEIRVPKGSSLAKIESLPNRDELQEILRTTLDFLDSLHEKQLAHKNLRPEFIYRFGEKLLIGGLPLSSLPPTELQRISQNTDNEVWIAPEQQIAGQASPASDIYTLGLISFFFATGKILRIAGNLGAKEKGVIKTEIQDPRLATLIIESLHPNPNRRPTAGSARRILEGTTSEQRSRPSATEVASIDLTSALGKISSALRAFTKTLRTTLGLSTIGAVAALSIIGTVGILAINSQDQISADSEQSLTSETNAVPEADSVKTQEPSKSGTSEPDPLVMPNFEGVKPDEVTDFLQQSGVRQWEESTVGSSVPKGMVAYTIPAAGEKIDLAFWNEKANYIKIYVSTGSDQDKSSKTMTGEGATISWAGSDNPNLGSWGFYSPTVTNGVLSVAVDAKFTRETKIMLGRDCSFLVDGVLRLGCPNNNPDEILAKADQWISPINFLMNIYTGKINTPAVFEISLRLKDSKGVRNETLFFTVKSWK